MFRGGSGLRRLVLQRAWLMRGGNVTYGPVPVATGTASAPTAPGTFHVTWKDLHHRSSEFHNAPMPYSVFFNGGDAFHQDSVTVRSNGCVHRKLGEGFWKPVPRVDIQAERVVTPAEIRDEGVSCADYCALSAAVSIRASLVAGFEQSVINLDWIICILLPTAD